MKKLLFTLLVLWGGGAAGVWYWNEARTQRVSFRTAAVKRGDLLATINATGTIEPEEVVDVGVQIAGEIQSFGKDPDDPSRSISYGSRVEKGTELAHLDDSLLKARVNQAKAGQAKAEADVELAQVKFDQTKRDLDRLRKLKDKGNMVSPQEHDTALANHESARASLVVARSSVAVAAAALEEANVNLGYTTIRSPVKGVILDRRVNIGQTVVASLNAPSIFLIAKDLGKMEIWASVNETDVGAIHEGQGVRFTVASSRESFRGRVSQIRLNASMNQSVVTYTVVVGVDNAAGKLLPYLTARLQFEVEERKAALLVPNAALRWQPRVQHVSADVRDEYAASLRRRANTATSTGGPARPAAAESRAGVQGTLWVRQGETVRPVPVQIGLTDGVMTEIMGDPTGVPSEVVVGLSQQEGDDNGGSPFLPKLKNDKAKK